MPASTSCLCSNAQLLAAINASALQMLSLMSLTGTTVNPLYDSEAVMLAALANNLALIADNYNPGGGGGGGVIQNGHIAIQTGNQGPYVVTFAPALTGMTQNAVIDVAPQMVDVNGNVLAASVQRDTITNAGFTFWLTGTPTVDSVAPWAVLSK